MKVASLMSVLQCRTHTDHDNVGKGRKTVERSLANDGTEGYTNGFRQLHRVIMLDEIYHIGNQVNETFKCWNVFTPSMILKILKNLSFIFQPIGRRPEFIGSTPGRIGTRD